jgi:membrane protein DedA with SNARE-associated domain
VLLSITATLVDKVTSAIGSNGAWMVFALMTLESMCIPVPSEVVQLFAGFLVGQGHMSLVVAIAAGVLGNVVGSLIAWWVGYHGGRPLILRYGRYVHVTPKRVDTADHWFDRYGNRVVFWSRMLPVIRTFISLPAGMARMPVGRFTLYTFLGALPWVTALTLLGVKVGENWNTWHDRLAYLDYVMGALIVVAIVWLIVKIRRDRLPEAEDVSAPE